MAVRVALWWALYSLAPLAVDAVVLTVRSPNAVVVVLGAFACALALGSLALLQREIRAQRAMLARAGLDPAHHWSAGRALTPERVRALAVACVVLSIASGLTMSLVHLPD